MPRAKLKEPKKPNPHTLQIKNPFLKAQSPVRLASLIPWLGVYPDRVKAVLLFNVFKVGFSVQFLGTGCQWVSDSRLAILRKSIVKTKILIGNKKKGQNSRSFLFLSICQFPLIFIIRRPKKGTKFL